ncbi:SDR family oxidoreductase [Novosphingobium sp. PhB165]|uniref:SDR family NAD(P)-dependent oxidoreductase n=1 Tax=Novosphingobium sp. PhB165 TaxID=2485105 RepID=UPI0010448E21|nr:SDR family oxidoreductase [Novosphingobium sp. PhB165]
MTNHSAIYPSLKGKRVLITGGATGIGAGLVEAFAGQGAHVGFLDIDAPAGETLAASLPGAHFRACDLRDLDATAAVLAELAEAIGGVDVLVNNAARDDRHTIEDVTPAYWDERMATNLRHQFFAAQAVVPAMKAQGHGVILNFGSISWHLGLPDLVLYQTAKAAVEGMTRAMARDLGADNIRVNTIVPGNVETPRQKQWYTPEGEAEIMAAQCLKARIQPADVAALAMFLASDDGAMCTGHDYFIDAGWR